MAAVIATVIGIDLNRLELDDGAARLGGLLGGLLLSLSLGALRSSLGLIAVQNIEARTVACAVAAGLYALVADWFCFIAL